MTLKDIKPGNSVIITRVNGDEKIKRRMLDMGLVKGVKVNVNKLAPLGDPIEIEIRGYKLAIRKEDAQGIEVSAE